MSWGWDSGCEVVPAELVDEVAELVAEVVHRGLEAGQEVECDHDGESYRADRCEDGVHADCLLFIASAWRFGGVPSLLDDDLRVRRADVGFLEGVDRVARLRGDEGLFREDVVDDGLDLLRREGVERGFQGNRHVAAGGGENEFERCVHVIASFLLLYFLVNLNYASELTSATSWREMLWTG